MGTRAKALLLITFSLIIGCAVNPVTRKRELILLSTGKERYIGTLSFLKINKETLEEGCFVKSGPAVEYLQKIVNSFMPFYERAGSMPVQVAIAMSAVPNAWSVPGYIVVNVGLIACMENEAQLAFVLGHELGHVAARHTAEKYTQSVLLSVGTQILGVYAGSIPKAIGDIAASAYIASYSRSQELIADAQGLKYMALAGYNPSQSYAALMQVENCTRKYLKNLGIDPKSAGFFGFLQRIFADHPGTQKRVMELKFKAADYAPTGVLNRGNFPWLKRWAYVRADLLGKMERAVILANKDKYDEAQKIIGLVIRSLPSDSEPAFICKIYTLAAYAYYKLEDYYMAQQMAIKAIRAREDYYVAYKIAGISGIKDGSDPLVAKSLEIFEECLSKKFNDQDYNRLLRKRPLDETCLKGAVIASCKLDHEEKCRKYCRLLYRRFGVSKVLLRYCR